MVSPYISLVVIQTPVIGLILCLSLYGGAAALAALCSLLLPIVWDWRSLLSWLVGNEGEGDVWKHSAWYRPPGWDEEWEGTQWSGWWRITLEKKDFYETLDSTTVSLHVYRIGKELNLTANYAYVTSNRSRSSRHPWFNRLKSSSYQINKSWQFSLGSNFESIPLCMQIWVDPNF